MQLPKIIPISWTVQRLAENGLDASPQLVNRALVELIENTEGFCGTSFAYVNRATRDAENDAFDEFLKPFGQSLDDLSDSRLEDLMDLFRPALTTVAAQLELAQLDPYGVTGCGGISGVFKARYVPVGQMAYMVNYDYSIDGPMASAHAAYSLARHTKELVQVVQLPIALCSRLDEPDVLTGLQEDITRLVRSHYDLEQFIQLRDDNDAADDWRAFDEEITIAKNLALRDDIYVRVEMSDYGVVKIILMQDQQPQVVDADE